jgi:hypothetical protein
MFFILPYIVLGQETSGYGQTLAKTPVLRGDSLTTDSSSITGSGKDTPQIKLTLKEKKKRVLRVTIDGVYAGILYNGIQNLDTGGHNPDAALVFAGEGNVGFWVGKYKDGYVSVGWVFNSNLNLDGYGSLVLPLDRRLTMNLGFPEKTTAIVKKPVTDEERHRKIQTLDLIQSSGPGATLTLKISKFFSLMGGAFLKNKKAELGAGLTMGKFLRLGGAYYEKQWMAAMRLTFLPVEFVAFHMKDSVTSVYAYVAPWKPKKIVSKRPLGYIDFWGEATYSWFTKKVRKVVGFFYTIPIPFLTKTDYTYVRLGASTDFHDWIGIHGGIDIRKYDF